MNFDGLRAGGVELIFKKLPISRVWGYPGPNSRARGHVYSLGPRRQRRDRRDHARLDQQVMLEPQERSGGFGPLADFDKFWQILNGPFSAVSTATIARIGAFFSVFRILQDSHTFAPLRTQNFSKFSL